MTIIVLTGWGQEGDRKLSKGACCDSHLVNPVEIEAHDKAQAAKG